MEICCEMLGGDWCNFWTKLGPDCCQVIENNISRFYGSECAGPPGYPGVYYFWPIALMLLIIFAGWLIIKIWREW